MEVKGFPNYLIYPDGRVFSKKSNKYLKQLKGKSPYMFYILSGENNRKNYMIHRLVAEHYISKPENKDYVDHINRDTNDNREENLRWVDRSENMKNTQINIRNQLGIKFIRYEKKIKTYIFRRKGCKTKSSKKNLSKLICYSFFYILKMKDY